MDAVALPYKWKQTLQDVDITIELPKGTKAKMLDVIMKKTALKVALKAEGKAIIDVHFAAFPIISFKRNSKAKGH